MIYISGATPKTNYCASCGKEDYDLRYVHVKTRMISTRQNICEKCEDDYDNYCDSRESAARDE